MTAASDLMAMNLVGKSEAGEGDERMNAMLKLWTGDHGREYPLVERIVRWVTGNGGIVAQPTLGHYWRRINVRRMFRGGI